jgi:DNA-binding NarL/FixJ family response regulator
MTVDSSKTVLVIDDSEVVLELVREALEAAGLKVQTRLGPQGSVNAVLREKPSLVLLDVNMPSLTGDAIAKIISRTETRPDTIILLHSSLSAPTLRLKAISTGADGFIQKSNDMSLLVLEVLAWLSGMRNRHPGGVRAVMVPRDEPEPPPPPPPPRTEGSRASVLFLDDDVNSHPHYRQCAIDDDMVGHYVVSHMVALRHAESSSPPDIIVSGSLQGDRGLEFYRTLRAKDSTWHFRFVLVTNAPNDAAENLGIPVLSKPVDPVRLREIIRHAMARVRFLRARTRLPN